MAVRSSATGEDALDASFAGQYGTVLDVEGPERLREAVEECLSSLDSARAVAYRHEQTHLERVRMSVVVQRMVDAAAAGVLFTADPVSGRRNCLIVETVAGRGEKLVSGEVTPDHYTLTRQGEVLATQLQSRDSAADPRVAEGVGRGRRGGGAGLRHTHGLWSGPWARTACSTGCRLAR